MLIVFVCIIIPIVVIMIAFVYPRKKEVVKNLNPIDGLQPVGTMGFNIGDSYAFCLSRFRHLDIRIDDNELIDGSNSGFIVFGRGEYNNINEVRCRFEQGHLFSVTIDIDYSKDGITDMFGILTSRICRILSKEPSCEERLKKTWSYANTDVILLRYLVPIAEEEKLLVQITFA